MKKITLILVTGLLASLTNAQKIKDKEVPEIVRTTFTKLYPKATEVKWEMENGNYEANFDLDEMDNSVVMDGTGKILETEVEMDPKELPLAVWDYLNTHYKGKKVKEAFRIMNSVGAYSYEVEVKRKELVFDGMGLFVKESKD
jgi:hypothetical protein